MISYLYTLFNILIIFSISFIMEFYKKTIRKNKYTNYECWIIGFLLSGLGVLFLYYTGMMICIFNNQLNAKLWVDYLVYVLVYYTCQLKLDMIIVKNMIKSIIINILKNTDLPEEQIENIANQLTSRKIK